MTPESARLLWQAGRQAWPDISVTAEEFEHHALAQKPADAPVKHPGDLYLAFACAQGNNNALAVFESNFLSQVPAYLSRVEKTRSAVEEVQQILRTRLLVTTEIQPARISEYSGRGPLAGWLRVVAVRIALEIRRSRKPEQQLEDSSAEMLLGTDPELAFIRVRYADEFRRAFAESLSQMDRKDRTVLRLHLVDGLNIEKNRATL